MPTQQFFDKWTLPFMAVVIGSVIIFGIYRGIVSPTH